MKEEEKEEAEQQRGVRRAERRQRYWRGVQRGAAPHAVMSQSLQRAGNSLPKKRLHEARSREKSSAELGGCPERGLVIHLPAAGVACAATSLAYAPLGSAMRSACVPCAAHSRDRGRTGEVGSTPRSSSFGAVASPAAQRRTHLLDDVAVVQHADGVRVLDGAEAVRNDQARAALHHVVQRVLNRTKEAATHQGECMTLRESPPASSLAVPRQARPSRAPPVRGRSPAPRARCARRGRWWPRPAAGSWGA